MIYQERDNKRKQKNRLKHIIAVGILTIFIFTANYFFPHFFSPVTHLVSIPLHDSSSSVSNGLGGFWAELHSKQTLVQENQNLKQQIATLMMVTTERDFLQKQNDDLKALFSRATSTNPGILGTIISKPGYSPYDTLIVDAGTSDKVAVGDLVFADESVVLGEVSIVDSHTSTIVVYSSSDQKNNVLVGNNALETAANGLGGGVFEVKLPQNVSIKSGDMVTLAKLPNKLFGVVTEITTNPTDSFERILFRSPIDINELKYVTILHNQQNHASTTQNHR